MAWKEVDVHSHVGQFESVVEPHTIPRFEQVIVPNHPVIRQRYFRSQTPYSLRSTCQPVSVINCARMLGIKNVPDIQDQIVSDERIPWDEGNGGIPAHYKVVEQMAEVYREYLPGVRVERKSLLYLSSTLRYLAFGNALTVSTGRDHVVSVAWLFRDNDADDPLSRYISMFVDPTWEVNDSSRVSYLFFC